MKQQTPMKILVAAMHHFHEDFSNLLVPFYFSYSASEEASISWSVFSMPSEISSKGR